MPTAREIADAVEQLQREMESPQMAEALRTGEQAMDVLEESCGICGGQRTALGWPGRTVFATRCRNCGADELHTLEG